MRPVRGTKSHVPRAVSAKLDESSGNFSRRKGEAFDEFQEVKRDREGDYLWMRNRSTN